MNDLAQPEPSALERSYEEALERAERHHTGSSELPPAFDGVEHLREFDAFPEFASRFLKVEDPDQNFQLVPFNLRWVQQKLYQKEMEMRREGREPWLIVLKYRRGGITTLAQGLAFHEIWRNPRVKCWTFSHRRKDTDTIFQMVSQFYDSMPVDHRHPKTRAAKREIVHERPWGSEYGSETAGARGALRGGGIQRVHYSEAASYPDLEKLHSGVADTLPRGAACIVESTANRKEGRGEAFYDWWLRAQEGKGPFEPVFFAWHHDPTNRLPVESPDDVGDLEPYEKKMVREHDLDASQLKWWRWKRSRLQEDGRSPNVIKQEHPSNWEEAFLEGGESFYDPDLIAEIRGEDCREPIPAAELPRDEMLDRIPDHLEGYRDFIWSQITSGRLRIFEPPQEEVRYVGGSDTAGGVGRDDNAAVLLRADSAEQVAAYNWNQIPPDAFGEKVLACLGWMYRRSEHAPAFWAVERDNHGHAVLTGLISIAEYPRRAVYHDQDETKRGDRPAKRAGWRNNKPQLTSAVGRMLRRRSPKLRDDRTLDSIAGVIEDDKGEPEFGSQDLAVSAGIAAIVLPQVAKSKPLFM